jgi:hypothetical protein
MRQRLCFVKILEMEGDLMQVADDTRLAIMGTETALF